MTNNRERIEQLLKKQNQIKEKIASVPARVRKEEDKVLTRKKILMGAYLLERCKSNEGERATLMQELNLFLTRSHDRKLFGLSNLDS